jgi:hypothetical protein
VETFDISGNKKLLVLAVGGGQLRLDTVVVLDSRLPSDRVHARLAMEGVVAIGVRLLDAAVIVEGCLPAVGGC